jgi:hypothetical protein
MVFQTFADVEGYLWSFPRVDHASVGIFCRMGACPPAELWQRMGRFLAEMCPGLKKVMLWAGADGPGSEPLGHPVPGQVGRCWAIQLATCIPSPARG